jgi:CrcB protein
MILYIALGGLLGTLARYGVQGWVQHLTGNVAFPSGTLVVNLAGSLLLGFLLRFAMGSALISPELRGGLTIGFCGAFTTMSTFGYESVALLAGGQYWRAAAYVGGSLVGCIVAAAAGIALANRLL